KTRKLLCEIDHESNNVVFARTGDRIALAGGKRNPTAFTFAVAPRLDKDEDDEKKDREDPKKATTPKKQPPKLFEEPGVHIVDAGTGKPICRIPAGAASFAFYPDGNKLVTLDPDSGLRLWDAGSGKELQTLATQLQHESQLAGVSPDGKWIGVLAG